MIPRPRLKNGNEASHMVFPSQQDVASSGKPVVLEPRDDQSRIAEVPPPPPQTEEHDEIAAQLERMEQGDDEGEDSKGRLAPQCISIRLFLGCVIPRSCWGEFTQPRKCLQGLC